MNLFPDVEGLYGCTYGDLNTESPVTYYVSVAPGGQAAANDKLTDSATTRFQFLTSTSNSFELYQLIEHKNQKNFHFFRLLFSFI